MRQNNSINFDLPHINSDGLLQKLIETVFIDNGITYNTCWEDPRIDRRLLDINSQSRIVMITSAGCNALDYLLEDPDRIYSVDINPAQNALLELKKALFRRGDYTLLTRFFGQGRVEEAARRYSHQLRPLLPPFAKDYWDKHIQYFQPNHHARSFYDTGRAGALSRFFHWFLQRKDLEGELKSMVEAPTLRQQRQRYESLTTSLWSPFIKWMLNRRELMKLAGVTDRQHTRILERNGDIFNYLIGKMDHVFSMIDLRDNYFWYLYICGRYDVPATCPNYLKPEHFATLRQRHQSIETHTKSITGFLRENPGCYSHYVLLDHLDWMEEQAIGEEWRLILQNSRPGTQILLRSVLPTPSHIPEFALNRLTLHPKRTRSLKRKDRVGTYGSLTLATVN